MPKVTTNITVNKTKEFRYELKKRKKKTMGPKDA